MDNFTNPEMNAQDTTYGNTTVLNDTYAQPQPTVQNDTYAQQNAYAQQNTYAQNDIYAQQNTYAQNDTYAQQNAYTQPNTYTGATAEWQAQHQQQTYQYTNSGAYNTPTYNAGVYNNTGAYAAKKPQNNGKVALAVTSMILGILSILCCCLLYGFSAILAIAGLILGIISLKKKCAGKGMAIAGIICSAVGIVLAIVWIIMLIASVAEMNAYGYTTNDFMRRYYY